MACMMRVQANLRSTVSAAPPRRRPLAAAARKAPPSSLATSADAAAVFAAVDAVVGDTSVRDIVIGGEVERARSQAGKVRDPEV